MSDLDLASFPLVAKGNKFEDFRVGRVLTHHWGRTFTDGDNAVFSTAMCHWSPMYLNAEFARAHGHPDVVVNPMLVLCTVVGLGVEDLSEAGGPFLGVEDCTFHRTVHPGDTVTARSTVVDARESESRKGVGIVTWHTEAHNQRGELVVDYRRTNLVAKRPRAMIDRRVSALTGKDNFFEDFPVGRRLQHARGATVGDVENNLVTKQVMNTAQGHWNEHIMAGNAMGDGRLVFGLVTGTLVFGLASQDTAENALAELGCTGLRFKSPVHLGDTIYAYTEVLAAEPSPDHPDAGVVRFKHWGVTHDDRVVFEGERIVLVKRRSHWAQEES